MLHFNTKYYRIIQFKRRATDVTKNMNDVINSFTHPDEYSCWTFLNMVNTFFILLYYRCLIITKQKIERMYHNLYNSLYNIFYKYKTIIEKQLGIVIDEKEDILDIYTSITTIIESNMSVLETKYGNPITDDILLDAISNGSLFIRKCYDSSLIEKYSHILRKNTYKTEIRDMCKYEKQVLIEKQNIKNKIIPLDFHDSAEIKYIAGKRDYEALKRILQEH